MTSQFRAVFVLAGLCLAAAPILSPAPVLAGDITLDQAILTTGDKGRITFKNVLLSDCNLSQSEVASLFSGAMPREEAGAMLERMTAREAKIPEAEIVAESGDRFVLHDIVAENIAKGGADSLAMASLDGTLPDDSGDSTLHAGPLRLQTVSLPGLAAALRGGDIGLAALRFAHLTWDGGEISVVDKGTAAGAPGGNRIQMRLGAAKVDQAFDAEGAPLDVTASFSGIAVKMPPQSKGGTTLTAFGYGEITADARFVGGYDAAAKIYRLGDYSIDLHNVGKIALTAQISGLEASAFNGERPAREKAMNAATVDWLQIDVTNSGLFDKIVAYVSLTQGRTPDTIKSEWRALVAQAPLLLSGAPAIAVAAKAVDRFIVDPKTLTLRFKGKDTPLKIEDMLHITDPMAFLNRLDVNSAPEAAKPVGKP